MFEDLRYWPRRSYMLMAFLGMLVALLFAWELRLNFALPVLFFFVIALGFAFANLRWATTSVELTPAGVTIFRRFVAPLHIDFHQIVTIEEAGRLTTGITLIYYPLNDTGLIDLDDPRSLFLPGLQRQAEVLAAVQQKIVE